MFNQLGDRQETQSVGDTAGCLCYVHECSGLDRPAIWIPIVVVMFASFFLLFALANLPYGIQLGSLIPYTAFVALGTFSAQRGLQPYFFGCSIVQQTIPRLLRRHCNFFVAIILLETIALRLTRYLPSAWLNSTGRDGSPFGISLAVICVCLASVQAFTNRTLLERAHEKCQ